MGQKIENFKPSGASEVRKAADAYIKKNYNVSAGNYFRKNADGSDGDDVSGMYSNNTDKSDYEPSNDETLNLDDYEKARSNYFMFNSMMEMGMQNYLNRNHVNSLVAFLNNKDNDESKKLVIYFAIKNGDWTIARDKINGLIGSNPTREICLLMADIELGENNDKQKSDAWIMRSENSSFEDIWICKITNQSQNEWSSLSNSGYFNSLVLSNKKMLSK